MNFPATEPPAPVPANAEHHGDYLQSDYGNDRPLLESLPRNSSNEPARVSFEGENQRLLTSSPTGGGAQRLVTSSPTSGIKDEWRIGEANRRLGVLTAYKGMIAEGATVAEASRQVGESIPTLWRWNKRFDADGFEGLIPDTDKCGRKSMLAKLGLTVEEINRVRGINLDTQSNTTAWRAYAQSDDCREEVARVILDPARCSKHALPPSLRRATKVNRNFELAHRGPRALSLGGIWTPRKLDILPGDIFCSDDTTPIWAWWVPWVKCEDYPYGVKLLQGQLLPVIDVASQCPITHVIIAREQSSYRAADIWRLFGHTFETVGLPRLGWQLERGSWESNIIRGVEVSYEAGGATLSRRIGGLRQLPSNALPWHKERMDGAEFPKTLQTWTSYLPKTKSVEAFFDRSQTIEGTLWGCLGRDQMRKPFEKAKQVYEACRRGKIDPRQHFLSWDEMSQRINRLMDYIANEPMEGEVFSGVPRLLWENAMRENPLYRLPEDQRWLYARNWKIVTITQGWARVRLTDEMTGKRYSLFYSNPELFAEMEGQDVCVYYDREEFEKPAALISVRTGEYLGQAKHVERRGSFLDGDKSGHDIRKAWRNAVMAAYGTVVKSAPSRQVPEEIAERRRVARVEEEKKSEVGGQKSEDGRQEDRPRTTEQRPSKINQSLLTSAPTKENGGVSVEDLELLGGTAAAEVESITTRPARGGEYGVSMEELDLL